MSSLYILFYFYFLMGRKQQAWKQSSPKAKTEIHGEEDGHVGMDACHIYSPSGTPSFFLNITFSFAFLKSV